jgi:PAS domain S-box-containing protein
MQFIKNILFEFKLLIYALVNYRSFSNSNLHLLESFINQAVIITKADSNGKITYVNKQFEDISGWKLNEVLGKDHNILNSGQQPKEMFSEMYKKVLEDKKIWNGILINKGKDGNIFHIDIHIKGEFDINGKLLGYITISQDVTNIIKALAEVEKKKTYLEHAAKIIRHDMHSGINIYIPRGVSSLERMLKKTEMKKLKIETPFKLIKEGLKHTQKVYKGVYEFTNLVKKDALMTKTECNIKEILTGFLSTTAYSSQVILDNSLPTIMVNEALFCTSIDNLIRNGLRYNDSNTRFVKVYSDDPNRIIIQDNGRGMSQDEFLQYSKPYMRKEGQLETGTGLGLNISVVILEEHGFKMMSEKLDIGTKIIITLNNEK